MKDQIMEINITEIAKEIVKDLNKEKFEHDDYKRQWLDEHLDEYLYDISVAVSYEVKELIELGD